MLSLADINWNSSSDRDMAYADIQYSSTGEVSVGLGQWIANSTGTFLLGYLYFITASLKLNVHIDHLYKD